jgi:selenium metabolism protein YedF
MSWREVDLRGLACPEPVVRLRKVLVEGGDGTVSARVDDPVSVENIQRLADGLGWTVEADRDGDSFRLTLARLDSAKPPQGSPDLATAHQAAMVRSLAVLISSEFLGVGDDRLGRILMRAFLKTLVELQPAPGTVIFLHSGVRLTTSGSELLDDLRRLESQGIALLSCGTCLDFYQLKDALAVGRISNMFEIVSTLAAAGSVLRP